MMLMVKAIQTQQYKQLDARSNECRPGAQGRSPLLFIQLTNIATDVSTELLRKRMVEEGLPPTLRDYRLCYEMDRSSTPQQTIKQKLIKSIHKICGVLIMTIILIRVKIVVVSFVFQ